MELIVFPDFGTKCRDRSDLGIRFDFVSEIMCREKTVRKFNREPKSEECLREAEARTKMQKFKIISVKICALDLGKKNGNW